MTKTIQKTISMPCHPKYLSEVRGLLEETLKGTDLPKRDKDLLILAVDEAISSIINHARFKNYENEITLSVDVNDVRFKASVTDSLNIFDFNGGMHDPNLPDRLEKERSFAMGIFLIRQIMDEITYSYRKGFENHFEMIKFL